MVHSATLLIANLHTLSKALIRSKRQTVFKKLNGFQDLITGLKIGWLLYYRCLLNPFAPEPPIGTHEDPCTSLLPLVTRHQFSQSRTALSTNLCRMKRSFKQYHNVHGSVKEAGEKGKNHVTYRRENCPENLVPLPTNLSFYLILRS